LPVQLVSVPLHQETGSVFQTALLDVTDRQRAEIIARGERANAEKIVQTIPLPLLLLDHTLRIRKVNRAFCEIFHATASIAEGRMLAQLEDVRWKSSGLFGRLREALVNGSAIVHFQVHCEVSTRRDPLVLMLQAKRLERPDHSASDLLLVFEDITRSEQARQEREHLMRQLQTARDDLEKRIQERTAELVAANARLQALSRRLVDAQETERRRIACELHDEVGQNLTALKLFLNSQVRSLPLEFSGAFHETAAALDELLEQVRRMALDLRPHVLDDLGLLAALQWHFKTYQARTKIRIRFTHSAMTEELITPRLKNAVFRITQEALTNVARHARVKEAFVRLRQSSLALQFEVTDTGRGFDPQLVASTVSSGLSNIQERVSVASGQCSIISAPGRGTKLTVKLPLAPHTTEESGP